MARVFIDGFESGRLDLWDSSNNASVTAAATGMDGSYCLYCNASNAAYASRPVPTASEYYVAFRFRSISSNTNGIAYFNSSGTRVGTLIRLGGYLVAKLGTNGGTTLATGTKPIDDNTTYLIEIYFKPADTGGRWVVKVDGITDIDYTGDTTPGPTTIDRIGLGTNYTGSACYAYYDNFIVDNETFPGNTRIQAIRPTAAGNSTQWTPSAGSNWDCVDEVPPSTSDYVYTNTPDSLDLYTFGDLSGSIDSIQCVQVQALAMLEGAPTPQKLQLAVRTGGSNYFSNSKAIPTGSPRTVFDIWVNNPNTSSPWEASEVNGAEFGIKAVVQ